MILPRVLLEVRALTEPMVPEALRSSYHYGLPLISIRLILSSVDFSVIKVGLPRPQPIVLSSPTHPQASLLCRRHYESTYWQELQA